MQDLGIVRNRDTDAEVLMYWHFKNFIEFKEGGGVELFTYCLE